MWANKAEKKCLPFMLTLLVPTPSQSYYTDTRKRAHTHTHTSTHTHSQFTECPTHNIPEKIFKLLSVNKQTPTYSSDRIDTNRFSSHWVSSSVFFFPSCAIFCLFFCMIQTMLYKCNPTSIQHFPNTSGQHYSLRAESWNSRAQPRR